MHTGTYTYTYQYYVIYIIIGASPEHTSEAYLEFMFSIERNISITNNVPYVTKVHMSLEISRMSKLHSASDALLSDCVASKSKIYNLCYLRIYLTSNAVQSIFELYPNN